MIDVSKLFSCLTKMLRMGSCSLVPRLKLRSFSNAESKSIKSLKRIKKSGSEAAFSSSPFGLSQPPCEESKSAADTAQLLDCKVRTPETELDMEPPLPVNLEPHRAKSATYMAVESLVSKKRKPNDPSCRAEAEQAIIDLYSKALKMCADARQLIDSDHAENKNSKINADLTLVKTTKKADPSGNTITELYPLKNEQTKPFRRSGSSKTVREKSKIKAASPACPYSTNVKGRKKSTERKPCKESELASSRTSTVGVQSSTLSVKTKSSKPLIFYTEGVSAEHINHRGTTSSVYYQIKKKTSNSAVLSITPSPSNKLSSTKFYSSYTKAKLPPKKTHAHADQKSKKSDKSSRAIRNHTPTSCREPVCHSSTEKSSFQSRTFSLFCTTLKSQRINILRRCNCALCSEKDNFFKGLRSLSPMDPLSQLPQQLSSPGQLEAQYKESLSVQKAKPSRFPYKKANLNQSALGNKSKISVKKPASPSSLNSATKRPDLGPVLCGTFPKKKSGPPFPVRGKRTSSKCPCVKPPRRKCPADDCEKDPCVCDGPFQPRNLHRDLLGENGHVFRKPGCSECEELNEYFGDCYQNKEYHMYHKTTFYDLQRLMASERSPQPSNKRSKLKSRGRCSKKRG